MGVDSVYSHIAWMRNIAEKAEQRLAERNGYTCVDWNLCKKRL